MAENGNTKTTGKSAPTREDRLKTALKANLARRKAQNREREAVADRSSKTDRSLKTPGKPGHHEDT